MNAAHPSRRIDLVRIATEVMSERGLQPEFPAGVLQQLSSITGSASDADSRIRDRTALLWCSIDNDDSLDLDQLTFCELLADGAVKILVAVSDVDALVKKGSAIDAHARINTTSVYTSAKVFPMLPVRLSNDLTSLNPDQDRLAVVTEMTIAADATIPHATTYRATRASLSPESLSSKWVSVSASSLGLRTWRVASSTSWWSIDCAVTSAVELLPRGLAHIHPDRVRSRPPVATQLRRVPFGATVRLPAASRAPWEPRHVSDPL